MCKIRKTIGVLMAACMVFATSVTALAGEETAVSRIPDYSRKGSVTVEIRSTDTGKAVPGGTLTLYQVASAVQEDGNHVLRFTEDFAGSGVSLDGISESDPGAEELASMLEAYVKEQKPAGIEAAVDENGEAVFEELELGLYLVVNTTAAKGYAPVNTFLITVPRYVDGSYSYDVKANPKQGTADTVKTVTPTPKPVTPTPRPTPSKSLPQTGQLWWPVPLLAIAGILFVMFGWYRNRRFGERHYADR